MDRRVWVGAMLLSLVATGAAGASLEGPGSSPRVIAVGRTADEVDTKKVTQTLERYEKLLGQHVVGPIHYYRYARPEDIAQFTGYYADGITLAADGEVHSIQSCHAHELVHVVAGRMGDPGAFFREGLAVALGDEGKWHGRDVDRVARQDARREDFASLVREFSSRDPERSFALAGSFVKWLGHRYGWTRVADFFRGAASDTSSVRFASTFGMSIEDGGRAWLASL